MGYLIRRDGSYEMYEKVHVTPDERKSWGLSGGKMVKTFDTDCARIGVLICYDVEFPELSRIMADRERVLRGDSGQRGQPASCA